MIAFLYFNTSFAQLQTFNTNSAVPFSLAGANSGCTSAGIGASTTTPQVVTIPVSGVGTLSASLALQRVSVTMTDCGGGTKNMNLVAFRVMAPNGTCVGVYDGGLSSSAAGSHTLNLVSSVSCLNNPMTSNDPPGGANSSTTSNYGFFNAQFGGTGSNLTTTFNGTNADGTWRIIFSEGTSSEPCVAAASLTFGNPTVSDQTANGDNCATPIVWNGGAICASTNGKNPSSQMPGSQGGTTFSTIGGSTCQWNGNNNNDVWIKFTPTATNVCISISGLDLSLQSIVVSDSNADGDNNACTGQSYTPGTNDPNWNVVSCPRPNLYTTTSGTQLNQQHCFTAVVGQMYYLVVDGNGGAESPFYITGVSGLADVDPPMTCPVGLATFVPINVTITTESTCNTSNCTVAGGVISAPASSGGCPSGSTLQYRITVSGVAGSWSTSVPVYDQDGPAQTIETRCSCNSDATMVSLVSTPVTTAPGTCVGNPACSCPSGLASFTPTNVTIASQSSCNTSNCTVAGGVISAPASSGGCPAGSTLQYRITVSGVAGSWSTGVPVYDQDGPAQTIETRCSCNIDGTMVSLVSTPVTTAPGTCVGNPLCSCPSGLASSTAPAASVVNSSCSGPACTTNPGSINAPTASCPAGSTLEYSLNGTSWSASIPAYPSSAGTVFTRCRCNTDANIVSNNGTATITPAPCVNPTVASITGNTSVCIGGTSALACSTPGGSWSSSNTAVATVNPTSGLVSGVSTGMAIISYTVTNSFGCSGISTATVNVAVCCGASNTMSWD